MSRSTIRQWLRRWFSLRRRSQQPTRSGRCQLFLEPLEVRLVPTTQTWLGAASGGDWDTPTNWSTGVPQAGDTAQFLSPVAVTHTNPAGIDAVAIITGSPTFSISAGSLTISNTAAFGELDLSGTGLVAGNGTVTVSGVCTVLGNSTLGVTGVTNLMGNSSMGNGDFSGGTLNNFGTVTNDADVLGTFFPVSGVINNEVGANWNANGSGGVEMLSGDSTFNNLGTLTTTTSTGGGGTFFLGEFDNNGTVNVNSGTFNIEDGFVDSTTGNDTGTFNVAMGTTLEFSAGGHNLNAGSSVTGAGNFEVSGGMVNVAGNFNLTGNVSINFTSGVVSFTPVDGDALFTNTVNGTGIVNLSTLSLTNNGTLESNGTVTVSGAATVTDSTVTGTGVTILDGSSTITGSATIGPGTLNNFGTVLDSAAIAVQADAVINNEGSATWTLSGATASLTKFGSGVTTFNNFGTLVGINTTAPTIQLDSLNNSGTINVMSGTLDLLGGIDTFTTGASVTGAGTFETSAELELFGSVSFGSASFTGVNSTLVLSSATITVTSALTWQGTGGGSIFGSGIINLDNTTLLTGSETITAVPTLALNNFGTLSDSATLTLGNGAVINNESVGTWVLNLPSSATALAGTGTFNNLNSFIEADAGPDIITIPFINSGTVNVLSGTLQINGGGNDPGAYDVASGATLAFGSSTYTFNTGTLVNGAGTFEVNGATLTVAGSSTIGSGSFTFSSGTINGSDTLTVSSATQFTWSGGTMSGTGVTELMGNSTISGGTLDTRTLINFATVSQTATLTLSNGAVIDNEINNGVFPVWNLQNGSSLLGGSANAFNNLGGTLRSSGPAGSTSDVSITFKDSGFVEVQSGTLSMDVGGDDLGTDSITSGATLQFNGGTYTLQVISFVQGGGNVIFNAGTTNVAGSFTPTGLVTVMGSATANFTNTVDDTGSVTFASFLLTGAGTLTGAATVTITGATTWDGGTMSGTGITNLLGSSTMMFNGSGINTLDTRTLNNFGTVADSLSLFVDNSAVINNEVMATWDLLPGVSGITNQTGSDTFNNLGTLTSSDTAGVNLSLAFTNSGSIDVLSGTLTLSGPEKVDTGSSSIASGATLFYFAGSDTFQTPTVATGAGTLTISDTATLLGNSTIASGAFDLALGTLTGSGSVTVTGATTWAGGTMSGTGVTNLLGNSTMAGVGAGVETLDTRTLNNFGTASDSLGVFLFNGAIINDESGATWNLLAGSSISGSGTYNELGTLTTAGSSLITVTTFNLPGTLDGSGTITFGTSTQFGWTGTMSGTGVTIVDGTNSFFNGTLDTRTLDNFGTVPGEFNTVAFRNGAILNNEAGATFVFNFSSNVPVFTGTGTFNNLGTVQFNSNQGNAVQTVFNNSGVLNVESGTLSLNGGGTDSGSDSVASGAVLLFLGGSYNYTATSSLTGAGSLAVNFGNVTVAGGFTLTGNVAIIGNAGVTFTNTVNGTGSATITSLTLNIGGTGSPTLTTLTGAGNITVTGATVWDGGTMGGSGVTNLMGSSTIAGFGAAFEPIDARTLNNFGTATDSATLTLANGAVINDESGATWNLLAGSSISGSGTYNELGTLTATGSSTIANSTFTLLGTLNGTGTVTFAASDQFAWNRGTMSGAGVTDLLGTTTLSGNDTLATRALNNFGTVSDGALGLFLNGGAVITNEPGSTWILLGGALLSGNSGNVLGTEAFDNLGQLQSGPFAVVALPVNNSGVIDVTAGALTLNGGGTDTGSDLVAAGATLTFGVDTYNFNAGSSVTGAGGLSVDFGGTVNVNGGFALTGPVTIGSGGTANFTNTVNSTGSATFTMLNFTSGTLTGAAAITVTGATTWADSIMSGSGVTNLMGTSNFSASFNLPDTLDTRTLNNFGTLTSANLSIPIINGAVINNESGATWNLDTTDLQTGTVNNSGTLNVSGGLNQVNGQFTRATITNAGTVTVADNSTFTFGTFTQTAGLLQGSGVLDGNVIVNGGVVYPGASDPAPGLMTVNGNYTQGANTSLDELIEGGTPGTQYSVLAVSGTATLGGTLNIQLGNGFVPTPGETFRIVTANSISGTFATVNGLTISGGEHFTVNIGANAVTLNVVGSAVSSITSTTASGTYGVGANINVTVTFSTPVTLSGGNLIINLNDGGTVTIAPFANSMTATGIYTVAAGQSANPLDTNSPLVLAAGATLTDSAGNSVSLLIPTGQSLANSASIIIVTTSPPVSPPPVQATDKIGVAYALPNGVLGWTLFPSLTSLSAAGSVSFTYGAATDFPLVGDWAGNGTDAVGVVRATPAGGLQWVLDTNDSDAYEPSDSNYYYGAATDAPVVGDWTGNGATKIGVVRALPNGVAQWTLNTSGAGMYIPGVDKITTFGLATDVFGAGDWTGSGKDTLAVVRASPGGGAEWVLDTAGLYYYVPSDAVYHFGLATDTPIVGDWNGAGKTEIGIERSGPNGMVIFCLDTNGDGVWDAGDQTIIVSASSAYLFEFGNWHAFSGMKSGSSPSTPAAANPFAGSYAGTFSPTPTFIGAGTLPVPGILTFTVDNNGNITVTNPGSGSGTVNGSTGAAQITGTGQVGSVQSANYTFDGTFVLGSSDSVTVSGSWTAAFSGGNVSGTWSDSRQ